MSFLDTLLVDGTDLRSLSYIKIVGVMDLFAPGDLRGPLLQVPRVDGDRAAPLPRASYILHVPVQISGATRGERNDNLRALGPLMYGDRGIVTLTRRIATGDGGDYAEHTAPGQFITGLSAAWLNHVTGRTELQFYNLKGGWWDGSTWLVP